MKIALLPIESLTSSYVHLAEQAIYTNKSISYIASKHQLRGAAEARRAHNPEVR